MEQDYRVLIQIRVRNQGNAEGHEIRTELCDDLDDVLSCAKQFIEETINALEDEGSDNE